MDGTSPRTLRRADATIREQRAELQEATGGKLNHQSQRETNMRIAYRLIIPIGSCGILLTLFTYAKPEWVCLIFAAGAFVFLTGAAIVTAILGFVNWRKRSRFWAAPMFMCLAFMLITWLTPTVGRLIADRHFRKRSEEFMQVVGEIKNGPRSYDAATNTSLAIIETQHPPRGVRAIKGIRCDSGAVVAAFLFSTDVPLLHQGYVYKGYNEGDPCIKQGMKLDENWPYVRHVDGNWYHFSDQPGL